MRASDTKVAPRAGDVQAQRRGGPRPARRRLGGHAARDRPRPGRRACESVVRLMLTSRFSMWMAWGPELTFFCNDAYRRDTLGKSTPGRWASRLGRCGRRSGTTSARASSTVLATGVATWDESLMLFLERSGYTEETYHTFSYSPIFDDDGEIAGMLCVVNEDTEEVIAHRRMQTLRDLGLAAAAAPHRGRDDPRRAAGARASGTDLPFSLVYLFDDGRDDGPAGRDAPAFAGGHPAAPGVDRRRRRRPGVAGRAGAGRRAVLVDDLASGSRTCPPAPGTCRRAQALVVPLAAAGGAGPTASWSLGLNRVPAARRRLPRLRRPGRRLSSRPASPTPAPSSSSGAGRDAGRARPGQDRLLHQRQPRVPHAADAAARSGRGRPRPTTGDPLSPAAARPGRGDPAQRPAAAQAGQHAARLLPARVRPRRGPLRAGRPRRATPASWPACSRPPPSGPGSR